MQTTREIVAQADWHAAVARHRERLRAIVTAHLDRASRKERHPVIDFLFHYYRFSPAQLMRWSPGLGKTLAGEPTEDLSAIREGVVTDAGWTLQPFPDTRLDSAQWVSRLQKSVAERTPRYACFGLHEWAMVYGTDEVRHPQLPLRLGRDGTDRFVESMPVACSHYDAFRFFTEKARPLNRMQPSLEGRMTNEQCGCLHVNMDLYKWSSMFYPWISSDLIADCFLLACEIREVDMRASPYDVSGLGYEPIAIETEEGRETYVRFQKIFAEEAVPLRERLIGELESLSTAG